MRWMRALAVLAAAGCSGPAGSGRAPGALLAPARTSPVAVGPGSAQVELLDMDGDGHLDLAARLQQTGRLVVVRGDGTGAFAEAAAGMTDLVRTPGAMEIADLDGDGLPDACVAGRTESEEVVDVLLGRPGGAFEHAAESPHATGPRAETWKPIVRLADLDGDGRLDLLVANGRRGTAAILAGDGRGGFGIARTIPLLGPAEPGRFSLALGDLDGDGRLDLVVARAADADPGEGSLWTLRGDGKGGFGERLGEVQRALTRPGLEALADVDGDGDLDVVLSHGGRSALSVLLHRGGGAFEPAPGSPYDPGAPAFDAVVSDIDADGRSDLVVATVFVHANFASRVAVLLGDGRGFAPAPGSPWVAGPGAYRVAVGDVDGDGRVDVAASCFEGDGVTLLLGRRAAR